MLKTEKTFLLKRSNAQIANKISYVTKCAAKILNTLNTLIGDIVINRIQKEFSIEIQIL